MKRGLMLLAAVCLTVPLAIPCQAAAPQSDDASDAAIERGQYLAEHVAMCVQCHTPRDRDGHLIRGRWFSGAPVPVATPHGYDPQWALQAPPLAGLPGWDAEEAVRLLTTGSRSNGRSPRPPMPPFRLDPADARAIVNYLKSLR